MLAADLVRAGVAPKQADKAAADLLEAARGEAEAIAVAAGKFNKGTQAGGRPFSAAFHKHSVDLKCGNAFVMLTREVRALAQHAA